MIKYKIDVLKALARIGWTQAKLKKYGLINGAVLDRLRKQTQVSFETLSTVCSLLNCQPGDLIENVLTDSEKALFYDLRCEVKSGLNASQGANKEDASANKEEHKEDDLNASTGVLAAPGAVKRKRGRPRKTVNNNIDTV